MPRSVSPTHSPSSYLTAPSPSLSLQVRHFFVSSELYFGVYALSNIATDEEVTLPFDFRYDKW